MHISRWVEVVYMSLGADLVRARCRGPHGSAFGAQINEALTQQGQRMERASAEEKARKAAVAATATEATKKRPPPSTPLEQADPKRLKVEVDNAASNSAAFLAAFDFTTLPIALVTDLIVANLQAFSEPALMNLVQSYRQSRDLPVPPAKPPQPPDSVGHTDGTPVAESLESAVKDEVVVDPLKMDIDEEEVEYEPDKLNLEVSTIVRVWTSLNVLSSSSRAKTWMPTRMRCCRISPKTYYLWTCRNSGCRHPKTFRRTIALPLCAVLQLEYVTALKNSNTPLQRAVATRLATCGCSSLSAWSPESLCPLDLRHQMRRLNQVMRRVD